MTVKKYLISLCVVIATIKSYALTFNLPANGDNVVGKVQITRSLPGDTFSSVGRRYDVGYYELVEANPGIDPHLPKSGTIIVIPSRFIIPDVPHTGIVINVAELRAYYFAPNDQKVYTFPVGIGRQGWDTPIGDTTVIAKVKDPTWVVPKSIKDWQTSLGYTLPRSVPPGPNDPLGSYALYLGFQGYRMHGTNDPSGIGRRSSSGCIRMWPEDIEELFALATRGEPVKIINDPYKIGILHHQLYLESHTPLIGHQPNDQNDLPSLTGMINNFIALHPASIHQSAVNRIKKQANGIPQMIS